MFFINRSVLDKRLKLLRGELQARGISEELRGWSWGEPPVEPPLRSMWLSVNELASRYCPTFRDVYLRRVLKTLPPPSLKMVRGLAYHNVVHESLEAVKRFLYSNFSSGSRMLEELLPKAGGVALASVKGAEASVKASIKGAEEERLLKEAKALFKFLLVQAASRIDGAMSRFPHADADAVASAAIPPVSERKVDGSLIGLSKELSVDIYTPFNAIADLKTGEVRPFHPYTAAGYALAVEADEETPINYGIIAYVKIPEGKEVPSVTLRGFLVSDEYRREFLEVRDEAFSIIQAGRDPGRPSRCPAYCPYYRVCLEGES